MRFVFAFNIESTKPKWVKREAKYTPKVSL